jgi:hypothetical protein
MVDRPERVAAEPTVPVKILTAAATATVATLVKKGLEQIVGFVLDQSGTRQMPPGSARRPATSQNGPSRAGDALRKHAHAAPAEAAAREAMG